MASSAPPVRAEGIPYAGRTLIALDPEQFAAIRRTVALLHGLAHSPAYQAEVDAGADALARFDPGNHGVFMGYDFHLTADGPRLIEINTNAGGALLNGLHTAALCDPERLACLCSDLLPVEAIQRRIVRSFEAELAAARGPAARLRSLAIADERPREQFLYREFELFAELFARAGIAAEIRDTAELGAARGFDLVYLRDTDFTLASPRTRALRQAYLAREVVVTPAPREHHLLANKRRLALFSSRQALARLGVSENDVEFLIRIVPETQLIAELGLERAWSERRDWVFKPCAAYGSKAVYRGDKISRRKLAEVAAEPGYLAQRRVEPGAIAVETLDGPREMKFDVRAYAYRDEILLLGARVYHGQVTNLRSPGGGFSAICVAHARLARGAPQRTGGPPCRAFPPCSPSTGSGRSSSTACAPRSARPRTACWSTTSRSGGCHGRCWRGSPRARLNTPRGNCVELGRSPNRESGGTMRHPLPTRVATVLTAVTFAVLACAAHEGGPSKTTIGAVGGAVAGGILGEVIGGHGGDIVAGAVAGGLLGALAGNILDQRDRQIAAETAQRSLETMPTGSPSSWSNPDTGNSGTVTPTRTYQQSDGTYCREYTQEVVVEGRRQQAYGTACRQADGSWKIVG